MQSSIQRFQTFGGQGRRLNGLPLYHAPDLMKTTARAMHKI
jgi:hypothetical protein